MPLTRTLSIAGTVIQNSITYTGSGTSMINEEVHIFSTADASLANALIIGADGNLTMVFDITGTVEYISGASSDAVLGVSKPTITFE